MRVQAANVLTGWTTLLERVYREGKESAPRGLKIRELVGTQLYVEDLRANVLVHPARDLNFKFAVAEWLWVAAGRNDVATVARYNSQIEKFSDDGVTFWGAYGPRLDPQWAYLRNCLLDDPDSRQAVATIWQGRPPRTKDVPCTISCQFLIRDGRLSSIWTMRSNDLWLGTPYDFYNFSQLTNALAGELNVPTGSLTLQAGSSHVYATDFERVERLLVAPAGSCVRSPQLAGWPAADLILDFAASERETTLGPCHATDLLYARALCAKNKAEVLMELMKLEALSAA